MSTSQCVGAHDIAKENLASRTKQPAEQTVLPPFSGTLSEDEELKLSNKNFKQKIDDFFKDKFVKALRQLKATPAFPTPYVLAQFAKMAYTDYERRETDAQYETRLALPDGWKLLTTASNTGMSNGYFGAAYWHPEHQHVVIAHRGTKFTNVGAIFTDFIGVFFKHHVPQMGSASTFAHKVVEVLREVNHKKGTNFQVFFTGHSLGGWLAQITTFTTEYLKIEGNTFLKSDNFPQSYQPHTVVFDSPGCKNMLSQMADKLDVRLDGRSIYLEHLDITSYLSAPNIVNTCNAHVGTVFRVFVDLSHMRWKEKHTLMYTLTTHSMDKIVEIFDPKTGQVRKDEQGKLKIQVVIDWPISGFKSGEEYKRFFKWAKHFNNYHPEITGDILLLKGYHPFRYQTKNYDERVTNISIFSQEERQFLESYLWLRQLPEFLKPKEVFSAMENDQAQEEAVNILQDFEIQNDTIRCTDASALQSLIPYVKRLLQLFPEIQGKIKTVLSSHEIRNKVYQFETRRYIEQINQSPLDFKDDALSLGDFLRSDQQQVLQLHMSDGDEWTGLVKVYQVLQKINCLSEVQYTVMKLKRLLALNNLIDFGALIKSTDTPYLILVACEANRLLNGKEEDIIITLFNTIKHKPSIKFIFCTRSEDITCNFLQHECSKIFGNGFVRRDEQLTWNDIITSSRGKLLERTVSFQGANIALNKLIPADSALADLLPLVALLEEKQLYIGNPVPICNAYNKGYYIGRTFRHQIVIKQDIFIGDLIAWTEQEFKQLCQQNPTSNVHWIERDKSKKLYWQQSQGSIEALRKYIDTHTAHTYTADDLDKLLEQARKHRVMLISDTAGMGKSTVLTHLSKQIKKKFPAKWVVRIDLNDHTDALKSLEEEEEISEKIAIKFVSENILKLDPGFDVQLFKQCCEQNQNVNIVIMLDGFDEISPSYKQTVIDLLQALRQTAVEQLWVTTRPHLREELEDELQQLSYTLEPFTEENQVEFLTKFWSLKDWFTEMDSKGKEEKKVKLEIYGKHLIKKLAQSISDKDKEFTGIPLQCRMLAEAFDEEVKTFCQSAELVPQLPFSLDLIGLYETFMNKKYRVCFEEKFNISLTNVGAEAVRKQFLATIIQDHQILALKTLFAEEQVTLFQADSQCTSSDEDLTRIGIVQVSDDGKLQFIHRTFAEYYVAKFLVNQLTKRYNTSQQVQDLLLQKIFLEEDYRVIRVFIDGLLSRSEPSQEVLKQYGNRIHDLCRDGELTLHQSALEGNAYIIGFFLESLQAGEHTDIVRELLLAKGVDGDSAWHVAAKERQPQVLQKLWEWGKKTLTADDLRNKFLLAKDNKENAAWQYASWESNVQILQKLWEWGKETLPADDLRNKLLLAKDKEKRTAWHFAAMKDKVEVLQKLWEWGQETLTAEELSNKLLLAKDYEEQTAWHLATKEGNTEILEELWECGKQTLTVEHLSNKLLLAKDKEKRTAWHFAAKKGNVEVLQKLWEWGKETLTDEELNNKLLLAKDNEELTAWHYASQSYNAEALQKMWELDKVALTAEEISNKLLLANDNEERTAKHYASQTYNAEALQKLWEWGKAKLTAEELRNKLLLAKDNKERTAWHYASQNNNAEALQKLWECGKETLTAEELSNKWLLAKDNEERTAWHYASIGGKVQALKELWKRGNETLTAEELRNKLLLAKDNKERTAWHYASIGGKVQALKELWKWGKETLTAEELRNKFLLAKDNEERTAWHYASQSYNAKALKELWKCGKETLTAEELCNKLLLAKDNEERTACHYASQSFIPKALKKLLEWGKETLTGEELSNKLLLAKDNDELTAWHYASRLGYVLVLHKLWECGKETLTAEKLSNNLLLAKDNEERTAWHYAAQSNNAEVLQTLWEWGKETLTAEELRNKLLLAKDNEGRTSWHFAAMKGEVVVSQKLWECGKETLTAEELNNRLLLAKDNMELTAWHFAALEGSVELLHKLWDWGKETLTAEDLNYKLLLAKDNQGLTAWHYAALKGNVELLQKLLECGKETLIAGDLNYKLLLDKDNKERTAWHFAALKGNVELLQKLWEWGKETLTAEELNYKLLLAKDNEERTAWHYASIGGHVQVSQKLWECGKETLTAEELKSNLLLAKDNMQQTAWHLAAKEANTAVFDKLYDWAEEVEINVIHEMCVAQNNEGKTALDFLQEHV